MGRFSFSVMADSQQHQNQKAQKNEGSVALERLLNTGTKYYADLHLL